MFLLLLRQKVAWSLLGSQLTVHRKIYVNINVYIEIHKEKYTYRHNKTKYRQAGKTRGWICTEIDKQTMRYTITEIKEKQANTKHRDE